MTERFVSAATIFGAIKEQVPTSGDDDNVRRYFLLVERKFRRDTGRSFERNVIDLYPKGDAARIITSFATDAADVKIGCKLREGGYTPSTISAAYSFLFPNDENT